MLRYLQSGRVECSKNWPLMRYRGKISRLWCQCQQGGKLFIYQARKSSLVPPGLLTAQFLHKLQLMKPLLWRGNEGGASLLASLDEWESVEKLSRMDLSTLSFQQSVQRSINVFQPSHKKIVINWSSFRNWAVRNHVETRLDSLAWKINKLQGGRKHQN